MKKMICLIIIVTGMMGIVNARAERDILVYVDRERLASDVVPQIINDRVMLPFRSVFEKMGATISQPIIP